MSFRELAISNLFQKYPNIMAVAEKMEKPDEESYYNPDHPGCISKIRSSVHPAGELMKLSLHIAVQNPENMKDLVIPTDALWNYLGKSCKDVQRVTKRVGKDILSLANHWDLREFVQHRVPQILP